MNIYCEQRESATDLSILVLVKGHRWQKIDWKRGAASFQQYRACTQRESTLEWPSVVQSRLCGWSYLIKFLIGNLSL